MRRRWVTVLVGAALTSFFSACGSAMTNPSADGAAGSDAEGQGGSAQGGTSAGGGFAGSAGSGFTGQAGSEGCQTGVCTTCEEAMTSQSNVGCEFWAVDLDQQDGVSDPASAPWGVVLASASDQTADVTIEINEAPVGQPLSLKTVGTYKVMPGSLATAQLPTRELDCGKKPNDYASPGTCLSSRAFRIRSTAPIVVYQFNVFTNAFSNDASLLLPTHVLGEYHRIIGWAAGHPFPTPLFPNIVDRSYITVVGTQPGTKVKVTPTYKIKGNPPIAETPAGGTLEVTIGPFDVLNLETANSSLEEATQKPYVCDLTGSLVTASAPVAVFSGVESTQVPGHVKIPTPPGWNKEGCCLDHLEDQIPPMESVGKKYVITRSPVRSTGSYKEPDVLRFVGAAETAEVTTTLPPPFDKFTIQPGEVKDTWTDKDIIVTSTAPVMVGQLLVSQGYVDGPMKGDPSLTVFGPVEQYRNEYVFLIPPSWLENWVVISAEPGTSVTLDGKPISGCIVEPAGVLDGKMYEARRCPVKEGAHKMSGSSPFGITVYGYGNAGSYAFIGGSFVKKIYTPPIPK